MPDDEVAGSAKTPRRISLSIAAEELANELIVLRAIALKDSPKLASQSITRLLSVLSACSTMMRQHGDLFAAASAVSDVIEISGQSYGSPRSYDSAHRAAVGEARNLLLGIWIYLDPLGQVDSIKEYLHDAGTFATLPGATNPSGSELPESTPIRLSRQLFYERWVEAKAEIQLRLSVAWERDFRTIPARIKAERQHLTKKRG